MFWQFWGLPEQVCKQTVSNYGCVTRLLVISLGKTTLLNVLTGRNLRNLVIDGEVYLNGRLCTIDTLKFCSAYVQQADLFSGVLTVREHLMYQVRFDNVLEPLILHHILGFFENR